MEEKVDGQNLDYGVCPRVKQPVVVVEGYGVKGVESHLPIVGDKAGKHCRDAEPRYACGEQIARILPAAVIHYARERENS